MIRSTTFFIQLCSVGLLLLGPAVTQAQTTPATANQATEQNKLNNARSTWNRQNPLYYDFQWVQQAVGFVGNYPWRVQVVTGVPARAVTSKYEVVTQSNVKNVPQMLDEIQTALSSPTQFVYATYDAIYGYPTVYQIQYGTAAGSPITTYRVSSFEINANSPAGLYSTNLRIWNAQRAYNYEFQYTDWVDQGRGINWPLTVEVRNNVVQIARDTNGNQVNFLTPWSIDQYFQAIQRQLNGNSPYIDITYAATVGYPDLLFFIGHADGAPFAHTITNFRQV